MDKNHLCLELLNFSLLKGKFFSNERPKGRKERRRDQHPHNHYYETLNFAIAHLFLLYLSSPCLMTFLSLLKKFLNSFVRKLKNLNVASTIWWWLWWRDEYKVDGNIVCVSHSFSPIKLCQCRMSVDCFFALNCCVLILRVIERKLEQNVKIFSWLEMYMSVVIRWRQFLMQCEENIIESYLSYLLRTERVGDNVLECRF